jgi:hypothetical protein
MRPDPVWKRILKALELAPMTRHQLCMCLSTSLSSIESALGWLAGRGAVLVVGRLKKNRQGHPLWIYGLAL